MKDIVEKSGFTTFTLLVALLFEWLMSMTKQEGPISRWVGVLIIAAIVHFTIIFITYLEDPIDFSVFKDEIKEFIKFVVYNVYPYFGFVCTILYVPVWSSRFLKILLRTIHKLLTEGVYK